jgi:hypothetical protein
MQVAREELAAFRAPLWNRYAFGGYPLLGNGESAPFSPFFLFTLFVPLPKQIVAMAGLKIFCALLSADLFARREGVSDAGACFAATAFAWSVFQTVYLYYSTTAVTALLPAALHAVLYAQERTLRRGVIVVAIVVAALLANGHPESVLHVALTCGGVLAIDLALAADKRAWIRRSARPLAGALAGLVLSAPAWLPVLQQVFLSARLQELTLAGGHSTRYQLTAIWSMVSANGFGNPVRHNWDWLFNYSTVATSYMGLLALTLAVTALVSKRTSARHRLFVVLAVVFWLMAMGWGGIGQALNAIPPFSITANEKLRFAALLLAVIPAARCADRMREGLPAAFSIIAACVVGFAAYAYAVRRHVLRAEDLLIIVVVIAAIAAMIANRRLAPLFALIGSALELLVLNWGFNALVDSRYYRPSLPIVDALNRLAPREPFRVAGAEWVFLPNASAQYGLEDIRGSDPMAFAAYVEAIRPITVDDPRMDFDRVVNVDHPLMNRLNVRFLMAEPEAQIGPPWHRVYHGTDGTLWRNGDALRRFFVERGEGEIGSIRQLGPGHLRIAVEARTPVIVGSSQSGGPGWCVRGDGIGVRREKGGAFLAFSAEPGKGAVELTYRPVTFYGALPLSSLVLAALAIWGRGTKVVRGIAPRGGWLCGPSRRRRPVTSG